MGELCLNTFTFGTTGQNPFMNLLQTNIRKFKGIFILSLIALVFFSGNIFKEKRYSASIVSFNIRFDNLDDGKNGWYYRKDSVAKYVLKYSTEIIGLQEVLVHQYNFLKEKWPQFKSYGVGREDGKLKGEMSPIFYDSSKYSLISAETKWLSETPDVPGKGFDAACERIVSIVWLYHKHLHDSVLVMNTHWDHEGKIARDKSADMMLNIAQSALDAGQHVIMLGDFNAKPQESPIQKIKQKMLDSCPEEQLTSGTYNGWSTFPMYSPHIDYIFYSKAFTKCSSYFISKIEFADYRQLSDHYMIRTHLRYN